MRIPLVPSFYQALMSGINQGTTIAHAQAQNAALAAQSANAAQSMAMKKQLLPLQMAALSSGTADKNLLTRAQVAASTAQANSINSLLPAKLKTLADAHEISAVRHAYLAHLLNLAAAVKTPTSSTLPQSGGIPTATVPGAPVPSSYTNPPYSVAQMGANSGSMGGTPSQGLTSPTSPSSSSALNQNTVAGNGVSPQWAALGSALGYKTAAPSLQQKSAIPSLQQKSAIAVQQANQISQNAINNKKISEAQSQIEGGIQTIHILKQMEQLETANPSLFHPGAELANKIDPQEARGNMIALSGPLVAALNKTFSSRGSNVALKQALRIKPGVTDWPSTTRGKIFGSISNVQQQIKTQLRNIKDAGGDADKMTQQVTPYLDPSLSVDPMLAGSTQNGDPDVEYTSPNGTKTLMKLSQAKALGAQPG